MSLFIIYTNQLRIHNKFALGNFKKKYLLSKFNNTKDRMWAEHSCHTDTFRSQFDRARDIQQLPKQNRGHFEKERL